ncbi:hypothetical protein AVEN_200831-1 [Araneus ventricosus]|uniref:Uncharacterized protein n=1 Tax=Araneus ventricosus TaxID=182803 RepID=A0A4Y2CFK3_ARAVE|nr:hypothetical protein AVEN_200831-1 [Araneus ventricosus]
MTISVISHLGAAPRAGQVLCGAERGWHARWGHGMGPKGTSRFFVAIFSLPTGKRDLSSDSHYYFAFSFPTSHFRYLLEALFSPFTGLLCNGALMDTNTIEVIFGPLSSLRVSWVTDRCANKDRSRVLLLFDTFIRDVFFFPFSFNFGRLTTLPVFD